MASIQFPCPACGQHLEAPADAAGCPFPCPSCQQQLRVPDAAPLEPATSPTTQPAPQPGLCAICQSPILPDEPKSACPACRAEYHSDCWQENGGCAVYGCSQVPVVEQRRAFEIPVSFWGQENKRCPACRREILAAAVRCRYCGATFSSARPEDAEEFNWRAAREERLPKVKRTVILLFVISVVPCCAPLGGLWGAFWYSSHREDVEALPSLYPALCKLSLTVAIGQSVAILFLTVLYGLFRGP